MNTKEERILVIIPAYNEENNIKGVLSETKKYLKNVEIVVINDGSSDNTAEYELQEQAIVLNHAFNLGIGASFQTGCYFASKHGYDYIVRLDADNQHKPKFALGMLDFLRNNQADIVIGSRFLGESTYKSSFFRLIGIRLISRMLNIVCKKRVTDPTSGFCAMNKKAYEFFLENCPEDYPEPEILIHHCNFRIIEMPISIDKREEGLSSISSLKSVYYMYKVLFSILMSPFKKYKPKIN